MEPRIYEQMQAVEDDHWWFQGRRAVIGAVLSAVATGGSGRVLDAGCGSGGNVGAYTRFGAVFGVDTEIVSLDMARRRGFRGVGAASLPGLPFRDGAFDLVCATDVIEHIPDDTAALRELCRVAVTGGHLLITVPAYQWLWSDSDVQLGHQRRYRSSEIAGRCRAAGWTVVRTSYFNSLLLPGIAAVRWARRRRGSSFAATELEQTGPRVDRLLRLPMQAEARAVAAGIRLPAGVSIACLCRN